jgi:hypothetical protein
MKTEKRQEKPSMKLAAGNAQHGVMPQKLKHFIVTAISTSYPTHVFVYSFD